MRVRVNSIYTFRPVGYDIIMPQHYSAKSGSRVRVINLPSAPKANTLGHCHIESMSGDFLGMVSTASLTKE